MREFGKVGKYIYIYIYRFFFLFFFFFFKAYNEIIRFYHGEYSNGRIYLYLDSFSLFREKLYIPNRGYNHGGL